MCHNPMSSRCCWCLSVVFLCWQNSLFTALSRWSSQGIQKRAANGLEQLRLHDFTLKGPFFERKIFRNLLSFQKNSVDTWRDFPWVFGSPSLIMTRCKASMTQLAQEAHKSWGNLQRKIHSRTLRKPINQLVPKGSTNLPVPGILDTWQGLISQ